MSEKFVFTRDLILFSVSVNTAFNPSLVPDSYYRDREDIDTRKRFQIRIERGIKKWDRQLKSGERSYDEVKDNIVDLVKLFIEPQYAKEISDKILP